MTSSKPNFSKIGVIGREGSLQVVDSLNAVVSSLKHYSVDLMLDLPTSELLSGAECEVLDRSSLGKYCDLIIVVGGDGSLLSVGRDLAHTGVPVLGVNRGGLGFLADISPENIDDSLKEVMNGEFVIENHFLLTAEILRDGVSIEHSLALNDVVVHLGGASKIMEFSVWVDRQFVYDQRSDGLIVASPTGPTAYSLSAGGPIMHPALDAILLVPMFPHTLTSRPLVIPSHSEVEIIVGQAAEISCDSQIDFRLEHGDHVKVSKAKDPLRLIYSLGHSFYDSCRSKLDWATRLGGNR